MSDSIFSFPCLCLMSAALWEVKYDLRITLPPRDLESLVVQSQRYSLGVPRSASGASVGS